MPRRPESSETLGLALEILRRIPRGRKITAKELHQQLQDAGIDRDLRTIQRQLEMLSEHFEIERDDRSKPFGYRWLDRAKGMTLPHLTPQESLLLGLAGEHLRALLPAKLMRSMEGFFDQARRNLANDSSAALEREWKGKVRVVATGQPRIPAKVSATVFETVSEALYANRWLSLDYRNSAGKESTAEVMPLGLAQQGPTLYLVCRYAGYDNERSLAMHRIEGARMTTESFKRPSGFDLRKYDEDGRFGVQTGNKIRLTFDIAAEEGLSLIEAPLSVDQEVVALPDGGYRISATVVETLMLERWLRGYGESISNVQRQLVDVPQDRGARHG
jgi:predicted DNA-binding transcriptional regulator YafY